MLQGDQDWWRLAGTISNEDRLEAIVHNSRAPAEKQIDIALGPVPCLGAIMTAPVVMLLTHPGLDATSTPLDYSFKRAGWPLSALHGDAPPGLGDWWRSRVADLIEMFGAQHVSNAVAALFLTPWCSASFADRLRLPSRRRMLDLAASAAARDALVLVLRHDDLWTESADIAALPPTRRFHPRSWRVSELTRHNLGDDAWATMCRRVEVHAWL